jgi:hypothetical protein
MAQVARSIDIDIDWLLDFLTREWGNVATIASVWDSWDEEARHDYLNEWPITESYGEVLQDVITRTRLTNIQEGRYRQLVALMNAARPTIDGLFDQA